MTAKILHFILEEQTFKQLFLKTLKNEKKFLHMECFGKQFHKQFIC